MLSLERLARVDWATLALCAFLAIFSIVFIYSSTYVPESPYSSYVIKQLVGLGAALFIYLVFCLIDFRTLCRLGYFAYFIIIILLVFTLIKGSIGMGAQRWIDIKILRFQPSELAKLFLPPFIVYYLQGESPTESFRLRTFVPIFIVLGLSFILVLKQPDLGTALIIALTGMVMLWYAGLSKKFFLYALVVGTILAPVFYVCLKPYQRKRIEVFLGAGDRRRERYHVEQSKIAIGSGGWFGKGLLHGTQNRLAFLPERRTDFIFSVLCEEWGFLGATVLILLYVLLIVRLLCAINKIKTFFAQLLALGLLIPVIISIVINIGMVADLVPVVGIPLPLMSYGLTHTWITAAALGWINGISSAKMTAHD